MSSSLRMAAKTRPESQRLGKTRGENKEDKMRETKQKKRLTGSYIRDAHNGGGGLFF